MISFFRKKKCSVKVTNISGTAESEVSTDRSDSQHQDIDSIDSSDDEQANPIRTTKITGMKKRSVKKQAHSADAYFPQTPHNKRSRPVKNQKRSTKQKKAGAKRKNTKRDDDSHLNEEIRKLSRKRIYT